MRRIALLLLFLAAPAFARELYWDELRVRAHLDAEGQLDVDETQVMVFDGNWNGGERTFDVRSGQGISLRGMERIDASGRVIAMREGSLDEVDHYAWGDDHVLRWRSRRPDDPPFRNTRITYVLHYFLQRILQREGDLFVLDHNFAFPNRDGRIERVIVNLTFDPVWQPVDSPGDEWTAGPLAPGRNFTIRVPLRYMGEGQPMVAPIVPAGDSAPEERFSGPIPVPPDAPVRKMLLALLVLPPLILAYALLREAQAGRLAQLRRDEITREWLTRNVLTLRAEVVGALWDSDVGPAEVSALIARLVAERKLESRIEGRTLHLTLKRPRGEFKEYEWLLIDGLFIDGDVTDTDTIAIHYAATGFDPAKLIKENLQEKFVSKVLPKGEPLTPWAWPLTTLWIVSVAVLVYAAMQPGGFVIASIGTVFLGLVGAAIASAAPSYWRKRVDFGVVGAILCMLPAAGMVVFTAWILGRGAQDPSSEVFAVWTQLGVTLTALWVFATGAHMLRSRESRDAVAFRKKLASAREFFQGELKKDHPALDDAWYPYIIAFGLGGQVEQWFRRVARARVAPFDTRETSFSSSSSSSSSSPSSSGWTGGGGAFGGAGASGAWAAAAAGVASGVSAPSSSSGSGSSSSSSSGGSSGGGGGGGW